MNQSIDSPPRCLFCGVPPRPDNLDDLATESVRRRQWFSEVRVLSSVANDLDQPVLSGVGVPGSFGQVHAPADSKLSYLVTRDLWHFDVNVPLEGSRAVYCFHAACWTLLCRRLSPSVPVSAIAAAVVHLLYSASAMETGYDLGLEYEITSTMLASLKLPSFDFDSRAIAAADPFDISLPGVRPLRRETVSVRSFSPSVTPTQGIDGLPCELLHAIMSYIPFRDIASLRTVSKALLAAVDTLPQSYWRSRFIPGNEAGFVDADLATHDWSKLFFAIRRHLKAGAPGRVNRWRICNSLEPIATLIEQRLHIQNTPDGTPVLPDANPNPRGHSRALPTTFDVDSRGFRGPRYLHYVSSFSGQEADYSRQVWRLGFRIPHYRVVAFESFVVNSITINTVCIGSREYISGISLGFDGIEAADVGFPGSKHVLNVPSDSCLHAIHVSFRPEGLTGIRFDFDGTSSPWFGQNDTCQGILRVPQGIGKCGLLLGLDHFKILSLGFVEFTTGPVFPRPPPQSPPSLNPELYLWTPNPLREGAVFGALLPSGNNAMSGAYSPLYNIDFGGGSGELLDSLTRVVFYVDRSPPFNGVEFLYADGSVKIYGERRGCEISFLIDGPAGERIERVLVLQRSQTYCPACYGIKLITNYGGCLTVASIKDQQDAERISLPPVPDGHIITGFVTSPQSETGSPFSRIALQSQPNHALTQPRTLLRNPSNFPDQHIQHTKAQQRDDDMYHTLAPLEKLSRITASVGRQGQNRPRPEACISGLKLEYRDGRTPLILGQWLNEHKSFNLSASSTESIRHVSVTWWYETRGGGMRPIYRVISRIWFETTEGRDFVFCAPGSEWQSGRERPSSDGLFEIYQSHPGNPLVAIAWELNSTRDFVEGVLQREMSIMEE
ncbi:hypothetical protein BDV18DRAFT_163983 [Aspergillus unguis]